MFKKIKNLTLLNLCLFLSLMLTAQNSEIPIDAFNDNSHRSISYIDGVVDKTDFYEAPILKFHQPQASAVAWERKIWRIIDVREKMNMIFRSPKKPFFSIIQEMIENDKIVAFEDDEFKIPIDKATIDQELNKLDTVVIWDPDELIEKVEVAKNPINWENIKQYRVKEIWYFDNQYSVMKCRILGIAPILDEYDDETGIFKYSRPLFWIYYPEAVAELSKVRVENSQNDISPLSWYDILEMRRFSSFIMKKSNILDLRVEHQIYGTLTEGVDRLMESEKIKAELFNFEHDLWEY